MHSLLLFWDSGFCSVGQRLWGMRLRGRLLAHALHHLEHLDELRHLFLCHIGHGRHSGCRRRLLGFRLLHLRLRNRRSSWRSFLPTAVAHGGDGRCSQGREKFGGCLDKAHAWDTGFLETSDAVRGGCITVDSPAGYPGRVEVLQQGVADDKQSVLLPVRSYQQFLKILCQRHI